jgi:hypothetical protein
LIVISHHPSPWAGDGLETKAADPPRGGMGMAKPLSLLNAKYPSVPEADPARHHVNIPDINIKNNPYVIKYPFMLYL